MGRLVDIHIGLGSNLPFNGLQPADILKKAISAIADFMGQTSSDLTVSHFYRSAAWPDPSAPAYMNGVVKLSTPMKPEAILAGLLALESCFGRVRDGEDRYASRSLDLDLLTYGGDVLKGASDTDLVLPHPRLHERLFVLLPLQELTPDWVHPVSGRSIGTLITALDGQDPPKRAEIPVFIG